MKPRPIPSDKQRCSILDCPSNRRVKSHRYPRDRGTGIKWIDASGNPRLIDLNYNDIYGNRYVVCHLHFRPEDYQCGIRRKLKPEAVPSLLLPKHNVEYVSPSEHVDLNPKIDADEKENTSDAANVSPLTKDFSPVTFCNWIPKSRQSGSCRRSSIITCDKEAEKSNDSNGIDEIGQVFTSTPKSGKRKITRKKLFEDFEEISGEAEPSCSTVSTVLEVEPLKNVIVVEESAVSADVNFPKERNLDVKVKCIKSRPCNRLMWKRSDLDENSLKIYQQVLEVKKERDKYRIRSKRYENRMRKLAENVKADEFSVHLDKLSALQRQFIAMILRNAKKKKNGRRYTKDERLLCLSIYKRSASAYRYLCSILPLPTPRRVRQLLTKIRLDCGVTKTMKDCLKEAADRLTDELDKVCILMWDEVSLKLHAQYSAEKDKVIGVEDWGTNRTSKYADHALVFMLRGIKNGWKIPLTYNFCAGQTTHDQLASSIKEVVRAVTEAGFVVAATVCDQGSSNMKAIKSLQADTDRLREEKEIGKYWTVLVDDVEFVPLYDVPHLLKCMRNNFMSKDIEIDFDRPNLKEEDRKFASWEHIVTAYEVDVYSSFLERHIPDITEQHVYLEKMNKMRVKLMMQVFSRKMSRFVDLLARSNGSFTTSIGEKKMPFEGVHTAFVLQLMNGIGDGCNGVSSGDDHPKRIPWSENSYHEEFFTNARRQLKSMRFVDPKTHKPVKSDIPCLQNLVDTLQGFKLLWRKLKSLGFKSFDTRNINQDPLENFFGNVKSHDFRSNKPTCSQFEAIFKSLLITNLTSKNSPGFNCEDDNGDLILADCKSLLSGTEYLEGELDDEQGEQDFVESDEEPDEEPNIDTIPEKAHIYSHSGDVIKSINRRLPSTKSCSQCVDGFNKLSILRSKGTCFRDMHLQAKRILGRIVTNGISYSNLGQRCRRVLKRRLDFSFFKCDEHQKKVFYYFQIVCVQSYCESVLTYINRILRGRIIPQTGNRLSLPVKMAYQCYLKTIRKGQRPPDMLNTKSAGEANAKKIVAGKVELKAAKLEAQNAKPVAKKRRYLQKNPTAKRRNLESKTPATSNNVPISVETSGDTSFKEVQLHIPEFEPSAINREIDFVRKLLPGTSVSAHVVEAKADILTYKVNGT